LEHPNLFPVYDAGEAGGVLGGTRAGTCLVGLTTEGLSFRAATEIGRQVYTCFHCSGPRDIANSETVTQSTAVPPTGDDRGRSVPTIASIAAAVVFPVLQLRRRRRRRGSATFRPSPERWIARTSDSREPTRFSLAHSILVLQAQARRHSGTNAAKDCATVGNRQLLAKCALAEHPAPELILQRPIAGAPGAKSRQH